MGERDPDVAPAPTATPWRRRAVLAVALALLAAVALVPAPESSPSAAAAPRGALTGALDAALGWLAGERAPALLGVLLLALAAAAGSLSLERRLGAQAPLLVGLLIFGSAVWTLVPVAGPALAPLALSVLAFALAYGARDAHDYPPEVYRPSAAGWRAAGRWLAVGLLLAELFPSGPLAAGLLLPAALAVPRPRRRAMLPFLLAGFGLGLVVELVILGPGLVTEPAALIVRSAHSDPLLSVQGLWALLAGRNVGLLVGYLPALLLLTLGWGVAARPGLAATCLVLPVVSAVLLPYDFAGGWINLSFLPVYGALWHLPWRPPRVWQWAVAATLCALVCWPLFWAPRAAVRDAGSRVAGAWPRSYLPYESTLRALPSRGQEELEREGGLFVRAVAGCRLLDDAGRVEVEGAGPATIWLATQRGLGMVALELGPGAPSSFEVAGATAGRTVFRPDGRVGFEVLLDRPRATHRLWFGGGPRTTHLIEVRFAGRAAGGPLRFRLLAAAQP